MFVANFNEKSFIREFLDPLSLQPVSLAVAQERSADVVLSRIVDGLCQQPGVALARVWLIAPGDICASCRMQPECPDQARCLHLAASAGAPQASAGDDWSRLDGDFRRFPLGVRKVGHIGGTGSAILVRDTGDDAEWIARRDWAAGEGIRSFAGQPLVFRGEILGVLGLFSRESIDQTAFAWLRTFADHAAVAIANSRAFAEIERLRAQLQLENDALREEVKGGLAGGDMVGQSAPLRRVQEQIELVAATGATVLILGESGTGKELVARRIHERSRCAQGPFIKVNCAAIPRELFESEFFGHARGAFTGALRDRAGRFEAADGGTFFLDEVGEIPLELQGKLLRVLQEGEFERVGEERTRRVAVRVIAATNRNLAREAEAGRFRQDLYYRLSVFPLEVPPLRQRREDIAALAAYFVRLAARRLGLRAVRLDDGPIRALRQYDWPGNIRELQNVIERAVIMSRRGGQPLDLTVPILRSGQTTGPADLTAQRVVPVVEWRQLERCNVEAALTQAGGKIYGRDGAAALLGMRPTTLASRMRTLGIRRARA